MHASLVANADGFIIPDACLHLADVGCAKKEHTETGLTYSAANGQKQLTIKKTTMEWEIFSLLEPSFLKLVNQSVSIHTNAHRRNFKCAIKGFVVEDYIAVERPIVIVRRASAVRLAV